MGRSLVRNVNEKRCPGQVTSDATATNPFGKQEDAKNLTHLFKGESVVKLGKHNWSSTRRNVPVNQRGEYIIDPFVKELLQWEVEQQEDEDDGDKGPQQKVNDVAAVVTAERVGDTYL